MDKKAERLRGFPKPRYSEDIHLYQLPIDKGLFRRFKAHCVTEGVTLQDKMISLVELSLSE